MDWYVKVLSQYTNFTGRATREEYWMFFLINGLITIALAVAIRFITPLALVLPIYQIGTLLPAIAVGARRMHDTGRSGWWLLCPVVNVVFACLESQPTGNEYGPNPRPNQ